MALVARWRKMGVPEYIIYKHAGPDYNPPRGKPMPTKPPPLKLRPVLPHYRHNPLPFFEEECKEPKQHARQKQMLVKQVIACLKKSYMTQQEIAKKCNCSLSYIAKLKKQYLPHMVKKYKA